MKNRSVNEENVFKLITIIYVLSVFFGNMAIINIHFLAKVVPTYYRVLIPVIFLFSIVYFFKNKTQNINISGGDRYVKIYLFAMLFWLVYGTVLLFVSEHSDLNIGFKELLSIFLGIMNVCICVILCINNQFDTLVFAIKCSVAIMIIIGVIEVITGKHISTSMYSDNNYINAVKALYEKGELPDSFGYLATGIFYNPNDYCAFLSIFALVFLYSSDMVNRKILHIIVNYIFIFITFLLMLVDDAWICIVALIVGMLLYLILSKAKFRDYIILISGLLIVRYFGQYLINGIKIVLLGNEYNPQISFAKAEQVLETQIENAANSQGSLFYRINTYIESIKEMFIQSKGVGLGAGSYSNYFSIIAEKKAMLQNPHSLWIEILVQYGVVVFILFVMTLLILVIKLVLKHRKDGDLKALLIIVMGMAFALACFAPSSYLQNSYYWLLIGMGVAIVNSKYNGKENNYE